jgi:hypothetical protein
MPQTIAVQRGTTTVAGNGTSRTTLFTLSSGVATRVLVAGISVGLSSGTAASFRNVFSINLNGSGTYLPVIIGSGNGNQSRYMALFPSSANSQNGGQGAWSGTVNGQVAFIPGGTLVGDNQTGYSDDVSDMKFHAGSNFQEAAGSIAVSIVPAQFWMANGDSLSVSCKNNNNYTANIAYHFITITES